MKLRSFLFPLLSALLLSSCFTAHALDPIKVVVIAGAVKEVDRVGHHDYLGGCRLVQHLLQLTPGVEVILVKKDWPENEAVFVGADGLVFYTDGAGKQAYLQTPERIKVIQALVDAGVGLTSIHQAVEFPSTLAKQSAEWIGANYNALSGRGHWDSSHDSFPDHPLTRGVTPWKINDGWLNQFKFPVGGKNVTPLVWSGKVHLGTAAGGSKDIVRWTFDRADGGRSFSFSGLDAHSAWELAGVRKLIINGILWTTGVQIPKDGYRKTDFSFRDVFESLTYPGFYRFLFRYPGASVSELANSAFKSISLKNLQHLIPEIEVDDLAVGGGAGVRAQAIDRDGNPLLDFAFEEIEGQLHVLNAPSPAATASLVIGRHLADRILSE